MKIDLKLLFAGCIILLSGSCAKKDAAGGDGLAISGFGAAVFVGGDVVSIYGTGFDPNPINDQVFFNGVAGEVATASPNRLQVIAPLLADNGKITVTVHGRTVTSAQSFRVVSLLQGTYADNFTLTADKQYLLRGNVTFNGKLTIEAGTVIYGEKLSTATLTAYDIDFEGTPDNPIVFTSDQPAGNRAPGDWGGIVIGPGGDYNNPVPNGILQYVRAEYAETGISVALMPGGTYQYLQASYCVDGIVLTSLQTTLGYSDPPAPYGFAHHLIAFGCSRNDFTITHPSIAVQFGLGLKDPYVASIDPIGIEKINPAYRIESNANGIYGSFSNVSGTFAPAQLSNFTLVGYNPDARNVLGIGPTITRIAGSGEQTDGSVDMVLCNSVVAASWQSGVAVPFYQDNYDSVASNNIIAFRNNFFAGTSSKNMPQQAGVLGIINPIIPYISFADGPDIGAEQSLFASLNDTTAGLSFSGSTDDLGIKDLVDYNKLHNPGMIPAAGSRLFQGARFVPGSISDNRAFNKDVLYAGAFGTDDWTKPWSNFDPQNTQY